MYLVRIEIRSNLTLMMLLHVNQGFKLIHMDSQMAELLELTCLNYRFSFEYEIDDVSSLKGLYGTFLI